MSYLSLDGGLDVKQNINSAYSAALEIKIVISLYRCVAVLQVDVKIDKTKATRNSVCDYLFLSYN